MRLSNKNEIGVTLALAALTTVSFAQPGARDRDARDHGMLPGRQVQSAASPLVPLRPAATRGPVVPPGSNPHFQALQVPQGATGRPFASRATADMRATGDPRFSGGTRFTGGTRIEHQLLGGYRILETTQGMPGRGMQHAVRYGPAVTGVVERPMKSGYLSRTYVQGGRVLYARVYRQSMFRRFGHAYSYERLVPAVTFGSAYYAWAARPWSTPVSYRWRWEAQPWYAAYGGNFTPYSSYSSLDEWLTDFVIAENLRNAYESCQAENAPASTPAAKAAPAAAGNRPDWESSGSAQTQYDWAPDLNQRPYWEEEPSGKDTAAQPKTPKTRNSPASPQASPASPQSSPANPQTSPANPQTGSQNQRPVVESSPPRLSGEIKARLNAQIKRQLVERQSQPTASDTEDLPDSLKPGHTLFRVNNPLDVPAAGAGRYCSLRTNDYIERTGEMDDNGMVPVKVVVGAQSDCSVGLATSVSVNDLEAMETEQQQTLTDALLAASKNMGGRGGRGLPQAPGATPVLLAAGQTHPAANATTALSQLQ